MGRIKITGYIDEEDVAAEVRDLDRVTGLTDEAYKELTEQFLSLEDSEFEYVD